MLDRVAGYTKTFVWALWFTLPYIVIVGFTVAVLAFFNQTQELYRAFAQEPVQHLRHILMSIAALGLLTYVSWLVIKDTMEDQPEADSKEHPVLAGYLRVFPGLAAVLLPAAAVAGIMIAGLGDPAKDLSDPQAPILIGPHTSHELLQDLVFQPLDFQVAAVLLGLSAAVFLIAAVLRGRSLDSNLVRRLARYRRFPVGFLVFAALAALILIWPFAVSRFLGALALVLLFSTCLMLIVRYFYNFSPFLNAAYLAVLVAYVLVLWRFGLSDYEVRPVKVADPAEAAKYLNTQQAFDAWYAARKDKDRFASAGVPYPVFMVAASGGGLYSARHTALTLARFQDRCPSFAQHVFVISGISGGSWGSAIFNRLADESAPNKETVECNPLPDGGPDYKGEFETRTETLLDEDFLSPLLGVGLFPNIFQAILPFSVERLNRSAAFANIIAEPWQTRPGATVNPFSESVTGAWHPERSGGALILNMTDVDRGYQIVAAPFSVRSNRRQDESAFESVERILNKAPDQDDAKWTVGEDLKIGSAVALSAGFPVVIGSGYLKRQWGKQATARGLADGGYYENSGVETLLQIIDQLRDREIGRAPGKDPEISIHVIILDSQYPPDPDQSALFTPIRAILMTRQVRAQVAITNLYTDRNLTLQIKRLISPRAGRGDRKPDVESEACRKEETADFPDFDDQFGPLRPNQISLDLRSFEVPLAFYLSHNSKAIIDAFSGSRSCVKDTSKALTPEKAGTIRFRLQCASENFCRGLTLLQPPVTTAGGETGANP